MLNTNITAISGIAISLVIVILLISLLLNLRVLIGLDSRCPRPRFGFRPQP